MGFRQISFINGEIYHIVIRSVEGITIFRDNSDYYRAIFGLYEFNNDQPVSLWKKRKERKNKKAEQGPTLPSLKRGLLVEIFAFCLIPNHIHLLLKQVKDKGITKFMRKLGTGYAVYFNKKYQRNGHLFQGRFRGVHIKNDEQLQTVFVYIHTNPVSLIVPEWKDKGIDKIEEVIKFLENYKWSSYQDYIGKKNFPSVIQKNFLLRVIGGPESCKEFVEGWLKHKKELKDFETLTLE
jgi:putative transposase